MTTSDESLRAEFARQRHALAEFGRAALHSDDLSEILQHACKLVSHGCGGAKAKVLEYLPDEEKLLVRAGVGWEPGFVGSARLDSDTGSPAGFALKTGQPVLTPDVNAENRFHISEVLLNQGVVCLLNVLIETPGGEPFGVLEVDSTETREFDADDIAFLETYANLLGAAVDRHARESRLTEALRQKDLLMRELQHRVKNDLQMVNSMISIQQRRSADGEVNAALSVVRDRIETIRQLNEKLYEGKQFDRLNLAGYLADLAQSLLELDGSGAIRVDPKLHAVEVGTRVAGPLGLIVNEFVTNSVKYAFDGAPGAISIELAPLSGGTHWRLTLQDDGKGMPDEALGGGTGLQLIGLFAKQLGGELQWSVERGMGLTLDFPIERD